MFVHFLNHPKCCLFVSPRPKQDRKATILLLCRELLKNSEIIRNQLNPNLGHFLFWRAGHGETMDFKQYILNDSNLSLIIYYLVCIRSIELIYPSSSSSTPPLTSSATSTTPLQSCTQHIVNSSEEVMMNSVPFFVLILMC